MLVPHPRPTCAQPDRQNPSAESFQVDKAVSSVHLMLQCADFIKQIDAISDALTGVFLHWLLRFFHCCREAHLQVKPQRINYRHR